MKKSHILGIVVIAVAISVIVSTAGDASNYVSFGEAKSLSDSGADKKIHVVGTLKKDQAGEIVGIETSPDQMAFKFMMVDENNFSQKVIFAEPMPTDFTKSEQVVVVGAYNGDIFVADKILLKCPSKYQEEEIKA
ncbi:MAG: cytochrome c maturation protein CcmE [Cytophagales bacterium]|nr:cytochrome c maturation protein CcmE [Cytophagales bacterium]